MGIEEEYRKVVKEMEKKNLLEMSKEEAMANVPDDKNRPRYETVYEAYQKYGEVRIERMGLLLSIADFRGLLSGRIY